MTFDFLLRIGILFLKNNAYFCTSTLDFSLNILYQFDQFSSFNHLSDKMSNDSLRVKVTHIRFVGYLPATTIRATIGTALVYICASTPSSPSLSLSTIMSTVDYDYSQSLAILLRESTIRAHDEVALSDGAKRLTSGQLSRETYIQYLMMLWHIYE